MKIHSVQTMRAAEQALFDSGRCDSASLMDAAVEACLAQLARHPLFARAAQMFSCVVVYAGKGKNAGDALGIARGLGIDRILVRAAVAADELAADSRRMLVGSGCVQFVELEDLPVPGSERLLIIDGLLGSGASGSLRPAYAALVQEMNALRAAHSGSMTLAVDIPTGLQPDIGVTHEPVTVADATLAIGCVKPGMLADGAEDYVGRLLCVPLPAVSLPDSAAQVADSCVAALLPRRSFSCFKNRAGRVRIVAGSPGYTGAARLCAEAALAAGAGLIELCCLPSIYPILAASTAPEIMVRPIGSMAEVQAEGADAMLIGPGLGTPPEADALRSLAESAPCPVVLDADALNLIAARGWQPGPHTILTPHPGEMRRLHPAAAQMSRAECVADFLRCHPCTLLLKGARSIIASPHATYYNSTGGPHMANGGQGDALSGVVAAFAAQGLSPLHAALLGAYACGHAADIAQARSGHALAVHATQLFPYLTSLDTYLPTTQTTHP